MIGRENTPELLPHDEDLVDGRQYAAEAAYRPETLEKGTDADTRIFEYGPEGNDEENPMDWWREARLLATRFMRLVSPGWWATSRGVRERATVQEALAEHDHTVRVYAPWARERGLHE